MMWKDSLAIGVKEIDSQHKELCDKIDALFDACKQGKGRVEILSTMDFLQSYTIKHFHDEEIIQQKCGYPKCKEHKAIHEAFIKQVAELKAELEKDGASIVLVGKINSLVIDWLIKHIQNVDKEIAQYIK
ncbi:bacteriohemerythrin [Paludicola sp. MB14-C6]|uniref:bacteriohemerythrin n=1 Tax=Paludihabitans sp. MB14-C6 TaxID=3070656 RepID=UPI0027DE1BAA|nr:bacteriohemerythrin [Paludicola sp. MB14-C6]WMJ22577.1 bacteriohemerythrin [Paludicola sp. MB14-C6]